MAFLEGLWLFVCVCVCVWGDVCLALSAAVVCWVAGAHMDAPSPLGLREECHSFFLEFQTVSSICDLNVFSRKNKVAASTLKRSLSCSCSLIGKNEKKATSLFSCFE